MCVRLIAVGTPLRGPMTASDRGEGTFCPPSARRRSLLGLLTRRSREMPLHEEDAQQLVAQVEALVHRCFERDPRRRASCTELRAAAYIRGGAAGLSSPD